MKALWLVALLTTGVPNFSAEIPPPIFPAGVGVNIHFVGGHEKDLDMIAAAGFKFIRMDFVWQSIERPKGQYDWGGYEELLSNLEKRGIRPIFILDYSHELYEETVTSPHPITGEPHKNVSSPQHAESIEAFSKWAAAAAKHFAGRHVIWEIWNEPNGQFWSPKPDAQQYTTLALSAAKAIVGADIGATIVGPASSGFPWEFLETFLKSGVLEYLDAVTVHPYRDYKRGPETAAADYQRLKEMIEKYAPDSKKNQIPILNGEWGYATQQGGGLPLETQAAFAARQQLTTLLYGVPLSIWYDWKNDGPDRKEREHNFGTVEEDLKPKPAYVALNTLTHELTGYSIAKRLPLASDQDYVLVFTNNSQKHKLAAWTAGQPHLLSIDAHFLRELRDRSGDGAWSPSGRSEIELGSMPQFMPLEASTFAPRPQK
jgi:hypothetical protein